MAKHDPTQQAKESTRIKNWILITLDLVVLTETVLRKNKLIRLYMVPLFQLRCPRGQLCSKT